MTLSTVCYTVHVFITVQNYSYKFQLLNRWWWNWKTNTCECVQLHLIVSFLDSEFISVWNYCRNSRLRCHSVLRLYWRWTVLKSVCKHADWHIVHEVLEVFQCQNEKRICEKERCRHWMHFEPKQWWRILSRARIESMLIAVKSVEKQTQVLRNVSAMVKNYKLKKLIRFFSFHLVIQLNNIWYKNTE